MPHHSHNQQWFTLVEVLVSVVLSAIILTSAYSAFQGVMKSQIRLAGVINIQQNLLYLNTKLGDIIKNGGTNDYEEYFARRLLWYEKSMTSEWWTYTEKSHYGNGDTVGWTPYYYCGQSSDESDKEEACLEPNATTLAPETGLFDKHILGKHVAYGQYAELGFNYSSQAGFATPMRLPPIFPRENELLNTEWFDELYLIKKLPNNSFERTFFRHIFIQDPSTPVSYKECKPEEGTQGCLGKIQMTRLISCDTLDTSNEKKPDGKIDAWVPHTLFWGWDDPCNVITGEDTIYEETKNLEWVDISTPDVHIIHAHFLPRPLKIPTKMSGVGEAALSSMIQIQFRAQFAEKIVRRWFINDAENISQTYSTTYDLDD